MERSLQMSFGASILENNTPIIERRDQPLSKQSIIYEQEPVESRIYDSKERSGSVPENGTKENEGDVVFHLISSLQSTFHEQLMREK